VDAVADCLDCRARTETDGVGQVGLHSAFLGVDLDEAEFLRVSDGQAAGGGNTGSGLVAKEEGYGSCPPLHSST
jgi:hypothetical protein